MRTTVIALATLATTAFLATPQRDHAPYRPAAAAAVKTTTPARLEIPASIRHEHKALHEQLAVAAPRRLGAVLRDTRASLLRSGRIVGLALIATGDAGLELR